MSDTAGPEYYLERIFEKFEEQEERLTETATSLQNALHDMLTYYRRKGPDLFEPSNEAEAFSKLDVFQKVTPHTDHLVLYIESWHKMLSQPERLVDEARAMSEEAQARQDIRRLQSEVTNPNDGGGGYGFWRFRGDVKKYNTLKQIANAKTQSQLTTTQRQAEFINYAKDVHPELNRLYDWLPRAFRRAKTFSNPKTNDVLYGVLRIYLEKLCSTIAGFSGAILKLREELVGERELAHAQAITAMKTAEYQALGGMRQADFYKLLREASEGNSPIGDNSK